MKRLTPITGGLLALALIALTTVPVLAQVGLKVDGAIAQIDAVPGKQYIHKMIVRSYEEYPDMDVSVTAYELAQELDGSYKAVPPEESDTPYSAYEFITDIDNELFRLEAGDAQRVSATIDIPASAKKDGGSYAVLHIRPDFEITKETLAVVVPNIYVPVVLNFGSWDLRGEITDIAVEEIVSGEPITCLVTLDNTGNYHYKAKNHVIVTGPAGDVMMEMDVPATEVSIIPTYAYQFKIALELEDLPLGVYRVESQAMLEDDTLLDTASTTFEISQEYIRYMTEVEKSPYTMNWWFVGATVAFVVMAATVLLGLTRRRRI